MKFLIYPAVDEDTSREIQSVSNEIKVLNVSDEEEALAVISEVEAMYGRITPAVLEKAHRLRWIQASATGLEDHIFPELMESKVILTNTQGVFSDHIPDHTMAFILMFARGFNVYFRSQLQREWRGPAPVVHLPHQTLGVIGLGTIGLGVARRAAAFEMRVIAVDAVAQDKPKFVSELWEVERLPYLLAESDFVVSCVPHTPGTVKLIGPEQLKLMKKTAYLINVSRGTVVDLKALTTALQHGEIAGAGLDVFETEPLPSDHPLWGMDNVIITPHKAWVSAHGEPREIWVLSDNLRRFIAGEPLKNVVDKKRWFVTGRQPRGQSDQKIVDG